jgi:predicted PurR-regulated permease PerM
MFYFFIDGEKIIRTIRLLTPIKTSYIDLIFSRFLLISRATIKGTLVIGFIQGTLGAITLLIFGVENWLLLGFIMIIFAIIPLLGAWLILVPAGIIQVILGNLWQGVGIILVSFVVISNIDNIIRPRIVGHGAKMHDLMIFFSTIGGLAIFGVMGFIIGPVIASFFFALVNIYQIEFDSQLQQIKQQ